MKNENRILRDYILPWTSQSLSALGSGMTSYALVLWLYLNTGSALQTALLSVCSYAPYVVMSIFAGALSDRWDKKRAMLVCDLIAACGTLAVFALLRLNMLQSWHLYLINAVNGLMNTVQQPVGEVVSTLMLPKEQYQRFSGLRSFTGALNSVLTPVFATALFTLVGINGVIAVDIGTFLYAFVLLACVIRVPKSAKGVSENESILQSAAQGIEWLRHNPLILYLMLFLASINLIASVYDAALPAMILSKGGGGERVLGLVNACVGIASVIGSVIATLSPSPKDRVRAICLTLLFSMSTENFMLAFGKSPTIWCIGAVLGWIFIPLMNANMDVIFRVSIPPAMQGRVYSCRNSLQFFTIPVGLLLGGALVDRVFEPFMESASNDGLLCRLFGIGKGSGAAFLFAVIGVAGVLVCLIFGKILRRYRWED